MRVAFTSTDGRTIDEHFGQAGTFWIWEVGPDRAEPVGPVSPLARGDDEEDRIAARANAVADCTIVYTMRIGGPAAAKLVARRIHPMKTGEAVGIDGVIGQLQAVLRGSPPPWLRKAMGRAQPAPPEGEPLGRDVPSHDHEERTR
jgi:nitrogen fixation protein NifX